MTRFKSLEELYRSSSKDTRDLSPALFAELQSESKGKKDGGKNKYNNNIVKVNGKTFASEVEYDRWCQLELLEKHGHILYLQRQVPFILQEGYILDGKKIRALKMVLDATFVCDGIKIAEDTKGMKPTADWLNKAKMFKNLFRDYTLMVYTRKDGAYKI